MHYFEKITESNKLKLNKPLDTDMVYYSELNEWYTTNAFRSLSIKYVIDQRIYYRKGKEEYAVSNDHYMLAGKHSDVKAFFESVKPVKSICIDICPSSFAEAFTVLTSRGDDLDDFLSGYFKNPEFFENVNFIDRSPLSKKLQVLSDQIRYHGAPDINREWFLDLVEQIIYKEYGNFLHLKNLQSAKLSTRKEIMKRLELAKNFMDDEFLAIEDIRSVAISCSMSEYHFFRCFRQAYGQTPLQYLMALKMAYAKNLLLQSSQSLAQVAYQCNYPDAFTFSKAFKRFYGLAPAYFRRSQREQ